MNGMQKLETRKIQSRSTARNRTTCPEPWPFASHHTFMKIYLLLAACLVLVGCGHSNREVLTKLDSIKSELTTKHGDALRWAFANKRAIDSAVMQWSQDKLEEARKAEALPPETEQKVQQYEALRTQLMYKEMEARGFRLPPRAGTPNVSAPGESYETLSNRVVAAKAPIADILERRQRLVSQYDRQFSAESLIAEYARDRFDLIVDASDENSSRSALLYRANGETLDITGGIIKLFNEKTKQ